MKLNIVLTIALILVNCIIIFLLVTGIILVWQGQNSTYFNNKHQALREIRRALTRIPCLYWHKKIEDQMSALYYIHCQKDEDCVWYPSCEFGCRKVINIKNKNHLQEKILRWRRFCWQNNPCVVKDYSCSPMEVECINYQCQAVFKQ